MTTELWRLPVPSTALLLGIRQEVRPKREFALHYEFEEPSGRTVAEALVFEGVEAFKCTYFNAREDWALQAYDRLIEVTGSPWAEAVAEQLRRNQDRRPGALRHLAINVDDGPCWEAICRSFRIERSPAAA